MSHFISSLRFAAKVAKLFPKAASNRISRRINFPDLDQPKINWDYETPGIGSSPVDGFAAVAVAAVAAGVKMLQRHFRETFSQNSDLP